MNTIDIVNETAQKLGVDGAPAKMAALLGATDSIVPLLGIGVNAKLTQEAEASNPKREVKGKYSRTEKQLIKMLTESTGAHFLDSGGAYGRNWQRNRLIEDWGAIPERSVYVEYWGQGQDRKWSLSITTNVFPYLANRLTLDKDTARLNRRFKAFYDANTDLSDYSSMEAFIDDLKEKFPDIRKQGGGNTYNGDSTLSQVLQYEIFTDDKAGECYVILQIHQGCDVRGGYTTPHIFKCLDDYDDGCPSFLFDEHDIRALCECTQTSSDDCGYHWYIGKSPDDLNEKLDNTPIKEDYRLPKYWQPKEPEDHSPLICSKCNKEVSFE